MTDIESITVTRHNDGRITAYSFPKKIAISHELLIDASKEMRVENERVTFTFANGTARYSKIADHADYSIFELIYLEESTAVAVGSRIPIG